MCNEKLKRRERVIIILLVCKILCILVDCAFECVRRCIYRGERGGGRELEKYTFYLNY